jgi:hypothetical protein
MPEDATEENLRATRSLGDEDPSTSYVDVLAIGSGSL